MAKEIVYYETTRTYGGVLKGTRFKVVRIFQSNFSNLQNKMKSAGNNISQEAIEYMAKQEWSNVREMENYFAKSVGYSELLGRPLTVQSIEQIK